MDSIKHRPILTNIFRMRQKNDAPTKILKIKSLLKKQQTRFSQITFFIYFFKGALLGIILAVIVKILLQTAIINHGTQNRECTTFTSKVLSNFMEYFRNPSHILRNFFQKFKISPSEHESTVQFPLKRSKILIGVLSTDSFLDSRAKDIFNTWGQDIDEKTGKLVFLAGGNKTIVNITIIHLDGVDDSYPPQKKSFALLKYMSQYIGEYDWFMRCDDDIYLRVEKLNLLLSQMNSNDLIYLGQPGAGFDWEVDQLYLNPNDYYCMGGPGVVFSNALLKKIAPYLDYCLTHLYTTHEDVEVGRCVKQFAGISCTFSYQVNSFFPFILSYLVME